MSSTNRMSPGAVRTLRTPLATPLHNANDKDLLSRSYLPITIHKFHKQKMTAITQGVKHILSGRHPVRSAPLPSDATAESY